MKAGEKHLTADGGTVSDKPFFNEETMEGAKPVVPLDEARPSTRRRRGGLPQSLVLVLAVIGAGAAGAGIGYITFRERAPQPAAEVNTVATPEPATTQTPASDAADTAAAVEKSDAPTRTETPARAEPERTETDRAAARAPDEDERVENAGEADRPRQAVEETRSERRRGGDGRRAARRDRDNDGKPKARLVGTITGRSRSY